MRELIVVSTPEKVNVLTAALVIAFAMVQTMRTLTCRSRGGQGEHNRKVLGGPAYNIRAPKHGKPRTTNLYRIWAVGTRFYMSTPLCSGTILSVIAWPWSLVWLDRH